MWSERSNSTPSDTAPFSRQTSYSAVPGRMPMIQCAQLSIWNPCRSQPVHSPADKRVFLVQGNLPACFSGIYARCQTGHTAADDDELHPTHLLPSVFAIHGILLCMEHGISKLLVQFIIDDCYALPDIAQQQQGVARLNPNTSRASLGMTICPFSPTLAVQA